MNLNGKRKNGTLGEVMACREQMATALSRSYTSDEAAWLRDKVDPEFHNAALISLLVPFSKWIDHQDVDQKEKWLVWALQNKPNEIRGWLGYGDEWTMIPVVCKGSSKVVRLANKNGLPQLYLVPATPRNGGEAIEITLPTGHKVMGLDKKTVTYAQVQGEWYKVFPAKAPSQSAISRAIRLYLLSILVGRSLTSTKDLFVYEMSGIKSWMLYGEIVGVHETVADRAASALWHLLTEPGLAAQLPPA